MGFQCGVCGNYHEEFPMDVSYQLPADYFKVPQKERNQKIYLNEDICVIDDKEFYVRGIVELPVKDNSDTFRFGTWARVTQNDFEKYLELWDVTEINELPFRGALSGGISFYPKSDLLEVYVHLRPNNERPDFEIISKEHLLGKDQKNGVTMEKVHEFVAPILNPRKPSFWKTLFGKS